MLKIKYTFIHLSLILLSSVALINCSDDNNNLLTPVPVDSSDFRYPFTDGSSWNYTITISASDIQPDSILHYFNHYPYVTSGTATILYDTTINSVVTKCFLDEFTNSGFSYSNRYYYINNDTALALFAMRQNLGNGILPLRKIKNIAAETDVSYLNQSYGNGLIIFADSLNSTLKYPMVTGTEWSHTISGITTQKKYLGFENVTVTSGTISCMKESVNYSYAPTGIFYNYYSKYGLIKTYWFINDNPFTTISSPDGAGTYDITQEIVVTSFNIP